MKILILDDNTVRHDAYKKKFNLPMDELTHVYTVGECIDALQKDNYDLICLDHDLGGEEMVKSGDGTGYEVAEWIAKNLPRENLPFAFYLHSLNPSGRKNMYYVLFDAGITNVIEFPFFWSK